MPSSSDGAALLTHYHITLRFRSVGGKKNAGGVKKKKPGGLQPRPRRRRWSAHAACVTRQLNVLFL